MKKRWMTTVLVVAMVMSAGFCSSAFAYRGEGGGWTDGDRFEQRHERRVERLAELLDLTAEQQVQVEQIVKSEHEQVSPYFGQLRGIAEQWQSAMEPANFNEATLRDLSAQRATIKTELVVSRARAMNKIYALLTAEQKALADKLQPLLRGGKRGGKHRGF
ncbi:MAG: hypothetical protein C0616_03585 [Desulfuromonas sp.]|nr:MAG: hypothetical protein C0616_03585 [Desulfuromonas sp.]